MAAMSVFNNISSSADINLEWLRSSLEKNFLSKIPLTGFSVEGSQSTHAYTAVIQLQYDCPQITYPKSLFLKSCRGTKGFIADSEFLYYTRDYSELIDAPIPKCYYGDFSRESGDYVLLLEDLSKTHYSNKDIRPTSDHTLTVATELARVHSYRWGKKAGEVGSLCDSEAQIQRFISEISRGLSPIMDVVKDEIPREWSRTIERVFERHPQLMMDRARRLSGQTLVHGDANPSNVLSPHDPQGKTYLIDRQPFDWSITFWLGVDDLVYMTTPFWETEDRRRLEQAMLKHYHDSLLSFGVSDYAWNECLADYKLCLAHGIYVAVGWGSGTGIDKMRWLWQRQLERSLRAFFDWDCDALLS